MLPEKNENRYFDIEDASVECPIKKLKYFVDGKFRVSKSEKYMDCFNPSTGAVIAHAPQCTQSEVESAIESAKKCVPRLVGNPCKQESSGVVQF